MAFAETTVQGAQRQREEMVGLRERVNQSIGDAESKALRVLVLTQYFWPETFLVNDVVGNLRSLGCRVDVLTGQPNYPDGDTFEGYSPWRLGRQKHPEGYDIFRVPVVPRKRGGVRRILNYFSYIVSAATIGVFLLRGRKYDVVFVYAVSPILQALPAILVSRLKRAALVVWVQDLWPDTLRSTGVVEREGVLRLVGKVTRYIYRRSDLLLAQSDGFVEKIRNLAGDGVPIVVHHNPGPPAVERHSTERPLRLEEGFNILFAGNFGTAQSMETILEAAELVDDPNCRFVLVGSGSRSFWLEQEITRRGLGGRVRLAGRFPPSAMPAVLDQASALLVTLARSENLALTIPSKIPAYLAAGKPILASLDGEANEVINRSGAGLAVPAQDAPALAKAIERLLAMSEEQRASLGRAGRAYFGAHFAPEELAIALEGHLRDAAAARRLKDDPDSGKTK